MAQLGFLGLGIMGYRMAGHLLKAGHDVALWSHTGSKAQQLAKAGKGTASWRDEIFAVHRDGYSMDRNNYRIYNDPGSNQMVFIPHGFDQNATVHF